MKTVLMAEHLHFKYTDHYTVKDLSLSFNQGEIVSVIGANGSGKSTVLRLMSRLLKRESGAVLLEGKEINRMKDKEIARLMTMLPQIQNQQLEMTVRDLVKYGRTPFLKWYEEVKKHHDQYIDWALAVTNLTALQHRPLQALSGGERQRAWIAMSIAQTPTILILDEPTSYLDISHQLEVMELLKELNESLGITIIMVLHDLNQAAKYSDRIIAMQHGKVVSEGTPSEVYTQEFFREVFSIETNIYLDNGKPICTPTGLVNQNNLNKMNGVLKDVYRIKHN